MVSDFQDEWQKRWNGLEIVITESLTRVLDDHTDIPRYKTLRTLTDRLKEFGTLMFGFFNSSGLALPAKYPKEYVLRHILDQTAFDIGIIARAIAQRQSPTLVERLMLADKLAQRAIQPAIDAKLIAEETTVLTYFIKGSRARVIPYAPVAIVALPMTSYTSDVDLLAIPHEIGHYVYWHAKFQDKAPWQTLKDALGVGKKKWHESHEWCFKWLEEVFADIYGFWVAGPLVARSLLDVLGDNLPEAFLDNDQKHPVVPIRPLIADKALIRRAQINTTRISERIESEQDKDKKTSLRRKRQMEEHIVEWGGRFKNHWDTKHKPKDENEDLDAKEFITDPKEEDAQKRRRRLKDIISLDVAVFQPDDKPVDKLITTVTDCFNENHIEPGSWVTLEDFGALDQPQEKQLPDIYAAFKPETVIKDVSLKEAQSSQGYSITEVVDRKLPGALKLQTIFQDKKQVPSEMPESFWTYLVNGGGWISEGPEADPSPTGGG